jgi:hypothetical protein
MIVLGANKCRFCGEVLGTPPGSAGGEEGDATGGVIPHKNVMALLGYYAGVFALIPCFSIGIAGLVLGILGLKAAKKNPKIRGQVHAWIGIIVGGGFGILYLVLTVIVLIGVLMNRR